MRDAELTFAVGQRAANAVEHGRKGDSTLGVRLRIEKDLHMHDAIGMRAAQVGER